MDAFGDHMAGRLNIKEYGGINILINDLELIWGKTRSPRKINWGIKRKIW